MKGTGKSPEVVVDTERQQETGAENDNAESTRSLLHSEERQDACAKLEHLFSTNKFQIGVMCLVIIDCLLVISELLIDLNIAGPTQATISGHPLPIDSKRNDSSNIKKPDGDNGTLGTVVTALHVSSIVIVAAFVVEMGTKAIVYGKRLINHKMEIVDGLIVVVTFSLDVSLADGTGAVSGVGLLIALRLWRVTRILNGIVMSVKKQSDRQLSKEKAWRAAAEDEITRLVARCTAQECEIEALRGLLLRNGLQPPSSPGGTGATIATAGREQVSANEHDPADTGKGC